MANEGEHSLYGCESCRAFRLHGHTCGAELAPGEVEYVNAAHRKDLLEQHAATLQAIRHDEPAPGPLAEPVPSAQAIEGMWHKLSWRLHNALRVYSAWLDWHALPDGERTHRKLYEMLWGAERDLGVRGM